MQNDNVLISEIQADDKTAGGIILPDQAQQRTLSGTVIAVGPGAKLENGKRYPMDVKTGEVVFYPLRTGDHVTLSGQQYLCIPEKFICGVSVEAVEADEDDKLENIED